MFAPQWQNQHFYAWRLYHIGEKAKILPGIILFLSWYQFGKHLDQYQAKDVPLLIDSLLAVINSLHVLASPRNCQAPSLCGIQRSCFVSIDNNNFAGMTCTDVNI